MTTKECYPTPLVRAASLSAPGRDVFLKNETVLPTGSFKVRGALHALVARLSHGPIREVVAASTGNHGAAVAYAAERFSVAARIFLPHGANPVKAGRIREFGATLIESGADLTAAIDAAEEYAARAGAFFLHDASDPDIPAGTATIGGEILEQCPGVDAVYVPMGDTALIRGVATALQLGPRSIRVVGVVAAEAPAYALSWRVGTVIETASAETIADGLAVRRPLLANVTAIRRLVHEVVMVGEQDMRDAMAHLRTHEDIVAEPSGAAAVAALARNRGASGTIVALVTGGNVSPDAHPIAPSWTFTRGC